MFSFLNATTRTVSTVAAAVVFVGCMARPTPAPLPADAAKMKADSAQKAGPPKPPSNIKPYDQVITADAKSRAGLFKVHRVGPKLYFEIPKKELNRDLFLVGRYARAAAPVAPQMQQTYGGDQFGNERTIRWEQIETRIMLRSPLFNTMADSTLSVYKAVEAANSAPIIGVFDIEAFGPDSAPVIDVTSLYTTPVPEFSGIQGGIDPRRSYIEKAIAFPDNVEIEATQSGNGPTGAVTVVAHWSMIRLPERPMLPRLGDDRLGFMTHSRVDFGTPAFRAVEQQYIARWRLEKKDPSAAKSDPIKPIVYYIDPATPDAWKPYVRAGVLEWQSAFEAAGFTNAIIPMDPPTNDPDWSPEDVRNTVIRWLPSMTENAQGPHISDPRTGEILNGSIRMFHNILRLNQAWYLTQVAPLDPRVQRGPMPDSLMGRLLQYVVAHEIGHTLGLTHNHKASSQYPTDSVRSASWVSKMGHTPSIMDYSRFNYVAQPEDRIPVQYLIPTVGPYDRFAIMWGYTPIPGAKTAAQERPQLNQWARMQDTIPWIRFGRLAETNMGSNPDPGDETEAVGDADAVKATALGIKNIKRTMQYLIPATVVPGDDYTDLRDMYGHLVDQWQRELGHVVGIVGGVDVHGKVGGQTGPIYTPVSRARQAAAVRFLNENAFATPTYLMDDAISRRIEATGMIERVNQMQGNILRTLLDDGRLGRVVETSARTRDGYTVQALLRDVQSGIFSELSRTPVTVDVYRRPLQNRYIDELGMRARSLMMQGGAAKGDIVAAFRLSLVGLQGNIRRAIPRAATPETRAHLVSMEQRIAAILKPPAF